MSKAARRSPRTRAERALEAIYAEIPKIPDCSGACAEACGPIAMYKGEYDRVKRSFGRTPPRITAGQMCPMLSPTGKCMVYTVRPFICRVWGATPALACPHGCKPTRWLTAEEANDILRRIREITGPQTDGPLGPVEDLVEQIALVDREARLKVIEEIKERYGTDSTA